MTTGAALLLNAVCPLFISGAVDCVEQIVVYHLGLCANLSGGCILS